MNKLKPCPFCGHIPKMYNYSEQTGHGEAYPRIGISCPKCYISMDESSLDDKAENKLLYRWNTRFGETND